MWTIVGLGNPGPQYARTRHNAGFLCIDALASRWGIPVKERRAPVVLGRGTVQGTPVVLAKPRTYMNNSGIAVQYLFARFGGTPAGLLVIYDDLDLPVGRIRIRPKGSAGGHNGLKSVIAATGTEEFPRVRVGIGRPPPGTDPVRYVMGWFPTEEEGPFQEAVARAAEAVDVLVREGLEAAMNRYNV